MQSEIQSIIEKWTKNQSFEAKIITLFEKVRDIPYGNIGSRNPIDVYRKNKGTCSGKHTLLKALYKEIGVEVKDYIIMHKFNNLPIEFPQNLKNILNKSTIIDPHNFLKIKINNQWFTVDVTWDKSLKKLGFPINENWDGKSNLNILVAQGGEIYETKNPILFKKELLKKQTKQQLKDRKLFIQELTIWLDYYRNL